MQCEKCGLELRVKRLEESEQRLVMACRNRACADYEREQPITYAELRRMRMERTAGRM